VCAVCGGKLRITVDAVWIHYDRASRVHSSSHVACGAPFGKAAA